LNFENENNAEERRKQDSTSGRGAQKPADETPPRKKGSRQKNASSPEVGHALRNIYQHTIDEEIPADLLDLLGKLG
jgi:hypothetical protein